MRLKSICRWAVPIVKSPLWIKPEKSPTRYRPLSEFTRSVVLFDPYVSLDGLALIGCA